MDCQVTVNNFIPHYVCAASKFNSRHFVICASNHFQPFLNMAVMLLLCSWITATLFLALIPGLLLVSCTVVFSTFISLLHKWFILKFNIHPINHCHLCILLYHCIFFFTYRVPLSCNIQLLSTFLFIMRHCP